MCDIHKICNSLFNRCRTRESEVSINVLSVYKNNLETDINIFNSKSYFSKDDDKYLQEKYSNSTTTIKPLTNRISKNGQIGRGAFGTVFKGIDEESKSIIAIKEIYLAEIHQASEFLEEYCKEIHILSKLSHKNIVEYLGCNRYEKYIQIYMEYVNGGSLHSLLKIKKKFNEEEIRRFLKDVLEGLEYLHQRKIVHRDIKAANVLITKDGTCKLADFGSSRLIIDERSNCKSLVGTCNWMAPEVIQQKGYGRFADIWSIGCLIIEMVTGKPPWSHKPNQLAVFMHVCYTDEVPELPNGCSSELRDLVNKCFRRDEKERPNVCEIFKHPFMNPAVTEQNLETQKLKYLSEANIIEDICDEDDNNEKVVLVIGRASDVYSLDEVNS